MGDELTRLLEVFHKIKKAGGQATLSVASAGGKTKIKLEIVTTAAPPIVSYRDALGSVFLLWGRAGQGRNPRGGAVLKIFGAGAAIFPRAGAGQGAHPFSV